MRLTDFTALQCILSRQAYTICYVPPFFFADFMLQANRITQNGKPLMMLN